MHTPFFIGDLHLCHKKIIMHEPVLRPFVTIDEHDEVIESRWNSKVTNKDLVYVMGDVMFDQKGFFILQRLKGTKILVMGNHDVYPIMDYAQHFKEIHGCAEFDGNILSHIPVDICQKGRYKRNIHAHLHAVKAPTPFHYCVSAEQINLTPIAYDEIIFSEEK